MLLSRKSCARLELSQLAHPHVSFDENLQINTLSNCFTLIGFPSNNIQCYKLQRHRCTYSYRFPISLCTRREFWKFYISRTQRPGLLSQLMSEMPAHDVNSKLHGDIKTTSNSQACDDDSNNSSVTCADCMEA